MAHPPQLNVVLMRMAVGWIVGEGHGSSTQNLKKMIIVADFCEDEGWGSWPTP